MTVTTTPPLRASHSVVDVLAPPPTTTDVRDPGEPECFRDLNLDQLVASVIGSDPDASLLAAYHRPATSLETVAYRHEVLRDLEHGEVRDAVTTFSERMRHVERLLDRDTRVEYAVQRQMVHMEAVAAYVTAARDLATALGEGGPTSRALRTLSEAVSQYVASPRFRRLAADAAEVDTAIGGIGFRLRVMGDRVHVGPTREDEPPYVGTISSTFERFAQAELVEPGSDRRTRGGGKRRSDHRQSDHRQSDHRRTGRPRLLGGMNHVEAAVVNRVARLFPEPFAALARFATEHARPVDRLLHVFARDIRFYLAYLDFADRLRRAGLSLCYPMVHEDGTRLEVTDGFDAALAGQLVETGTVVTNDVRASGEERVIVVSGPNQGGKTTFARMVGQVAYLASLGLPVPGSRATVPLVDRILTHFERGENLDDLRGALEDELVRFRGILQRSTRRTLVIINEVFSSTSLDDASFLARRTLGAVIEQGSLCVCVTFLDELSRLDEHTVSYVSQVDPDDVAKRTFRVERRAADGRAYAVSLAHSYGLDTEGIRRTIDPGRIDPGRIGPGGVTPRRGAEA